VTDGSATFADSEGASGGWRVRRVGETASTNADLLALAEAGEPAGLVLVADHQTAGRGRLGRRWSAPPGASLLVSALLRPPPGAPVHGATWAAGLAARHACATAAGVVADLKWPNDLLVGERKVAGILAEALVVEGVVAAVVVGTGLNVNWPPVEDLPGELADVVVALNHLVGRPLDRERVLQAYLEALQLYVGLWERAPAELAAAYRSTLATLGRDVSVTVPSGSLTGRAVDLDDEGALVVETADGQQHVVRAGDVVHLRPA
jgi:BirA family transcriptional regulator, biotin operon repressor / biotin---[acetyl-CoA-carboxylase] ligase